MNTTIQKAYHRSYIIEQLAKHDYTDVEGKSDQELLNKLASLRALEINVECDANRYF